MKKNNRKFVKPQPLNREKVLERYLETNVYIREDTAQEPPVYTVLKRRGPLAPPQALQDFQSKAEAQAFRENYIQTHLKETLVFWTSAVEAVSRQDRYDLINRPFNPISNRYIIFDKQENKTIGEFGLYEEAEFVLGSLLLTGTMDNSQYPLPD
jgi:hypothetical protein